MNKIMHKIVLSLTLILQCFFGLLGSQGVANAQTPQQVGTINLPIQRQLIDTTNPLMKRLSLSMGDARFVRNATGALVLNVPAGEAADLIYTKIGSTPQVWAAYSPGSATGKIQIIRAIKRGGAVTIFAYDFDPKIIGPMAVRDGYHSVDPYADFASNSDAMWHNISASAFLAAVGKAMLRERTPISYVAIANVTQEQQTSSSDGLLTTSSTTTVTSFVQPSWIFGTPVENGGQQAFAAQYIINPARCNPTFDPRKCVVNGGVSFVSMVGGNMSENRDMIDMQSVTQTSWSFLAMIIFVALTFYVGGLAVTAAAGPAGAAGIAAAAGTAGSIGAGTIAAGAAATYAGLNMVLQGTTCLTCTQGSWFGNIGSGIAAPSPGGFGDPSAAVHARFVAPGVVGGVSGGANLLTGQQNHWNQQVPKVWNANHDPVYLQQSPPQRSGVMQNYGANPVH